jgi:pyrroline-5-carboxylate reductase
MKVAVMGCGNMGKAIISGLVNAYGPDVSVTAFDKISGAMSSLPDSVVRKEPRSWFTRSAIPDAVLIAVKPQDVESACLAIKTAAGKSATRPLWISIAAGVTIGKLEKTLGKSARICRVMPNMPALIGKGVSAYCLNSACCTNDSLIAEKILASCGKSVAVAEKAMDAVTGLSGSGPAYVFLFLEALIEAGVTAGLTYDVSKQLAVQTVAGSAEMAAFSNDTPSQLKAKVMSPGGTTSRGLMELENQGFKYGIIKAVVSATRRAAELGGK